MKFSPTVLGSLVFLSFVGGGTLPIGRDAVPETAAASATPAEPTKLALVWTSGDPEVAHRMALMYCHAAKGAGWFEDVELIVWGPSSRLLAADKDLQAKIKKMQEDGIVTRACIACANSYGVTEDLRALDIEVKPMGTPLSNLLKDPAVRVITF